MKDTMEIRNDNDRIFLKKGFFGWKVIHPIKIDNKINWKNFIAGGHWWNLVWIALIVLIILLIIKEYSLAITSLNDCMNQSSAFQLTSNPWGLPPGNSSADLGLEQFEGDFIRGLSR